MAFLQGCYCPAVHDDTSKTGASFDLKRKLSVGSDFKNAPAPKALQ